MGKQLIVVAVAMVLSAGLAEGAAPDSLWSKTFGGVGDDGCHAVAELPDGRLVMAGTSRSWEGGGLHYWLVQTSSEGDILWSEVYGDGDCTAMALTMDGGFALGGERLVCIDSTGRRRWEQNLGIKGNAIAQASDGGLVVAGMIVAGEANYDYKIVRYDRDGNMMWERQCGGGQLEECFAVVESNDGGFVMAGYESSYGADRDIWLVKVNAQGRIVWARSYARPGPDVCYGMVATDDGGYVLAGETTKNGRETDMEFLLMKTDANGVGVWLRTYGKNTRQEGCNGIAKTRDGGFILGGVTINTGARDSNVMVVRVNSDGDSLWAKTFPGARNDNCLSVSQTRDGGYAIAGYTYSFGSGAGDYWLLKLASEDAGEVQPEQGEVPFILSLAEPYPNPFNDSQHLMYRTATAGRYELTVVDPLGRAVRRIFAGNVPAGEHQVSWNATGLAAGQYYIRLDAGRGEGQVRPVVLVR